MGETVWTHFIWTIAFSFTHVFYALSLVLLFSLHGALHLHLHFSYHYLRSLHILPLCGAFLPTSHGTSPMHTTRIWGTSYPRTMHTGATPHSFLLSISTSVSHLLVSQINISLYHFWHGRDSWFIHWLYLLKGREFV